MQRKTRAASAPARITADRLLAGEAQQTRRTDPEGRGWSHFSHGADIGVRGRGASLQEAFEQAGLALTGVITDPASVRCEREVGIVCHAPDNELLLMDWLNALVYEMATRRMIFGRFQVAVDGHSLQARAWGEPVDVARHEPAVEIKGATCTGLSVSQSGSEWTAECIVDV